MAKRGVRRFEDQGGIFCEVLEGYLWGMDVWCGRRKEGTVVMHGRGTRRYEAFIQKIITTSKCWRVLEYGSGGYS